MYWSTINIDTAIKLHTPTFLRPKNSVPFMLPVAQTLQRIADETLYKMQHNGTKIYLEKMLNESYQVPGYNANNHEATKLIYIDDVVEETKLFIWQNEETEVSYLQDDGTNNEDDIFLQGDTESGLGYSWIIFMPQSISFEEYALRALVDSYRYIGKKYTIEIYTP